MTELQANCALTYLGNNIFLLADFSQALLQVHILSIPDPDAQESIYLLLTPPSSAVPTKPQQREMRVQVLLAVGKNQLYKD